MDILLLIQNLHRAALSHKESCKGDSCEVSLTLIHFAARELSKRLSPQDLQIYESIVWPH